MLTLKSLLASLFLVTKYEWLRVVKILFTTIATICTIYFWGMALGLYYTPNQAVTARENFNKQHPFLYSTLEEVEYRDSQAKPLVPVKVVNQAEIEDLFQQLASPSPTIVLSKAFAQKVLGMLFVFITIQFAFGLIVLHFARIAGEELTEMVLRVLEILPRVKLALPILAHKDAQLSIIYGPQKELVH